MNTVLPLVPLAAPTGEAAKSGPWGLAIILLLCLACYFLFKSMSKHLRKVSEQYPEDGPRRPGERPVRPTRAQLQRAQLKPVERTPGGGKSEAGVSLVKPTEPEPSEPESVAPASSEPKPDETDR